MGSLPSVLLHESELTEVLEQAQSEIKDVLDKFTQLGSNWTLSKVEKVKVCMATYNPIGGSNFIATPEKIKNTLAVLNIENDDTKCFVWSVLAA